MSLARTLLRTRQARVVLAVLALALAWQAWLGFMAPRKLAPELPRGAGPKVNLRVTLAFPPERFHVLAFQKYGRVSGTEDNTVELRGVQRADLPSLARPHWVKRVEPLPNEGA